MNYKNINMLMECVQCYLVPPSMPVSESGRALSEQCLSYLEQSPHVGSGSSGGGGRVEEGVSQDLLHVVDHSRHHLLSSGDDLRREKCCM